MENVKIFFRFQYNFIMPLPPFIFNIPPILTPGGIFFEKTAAVHKITAAVFLLISPQQFFITVPFSRTVHCTAQAHFLRQNRAFFH